MSAVLVIGDRNNIPAPDAALGVSTPQDFPLVCREVLGESPVGRIVQRLQDAGIRSISCFAPDLACDALMAVAGRYRNIAFTCKSLSSADDWVEEVEDSADTILLVKLGAYVEFDVPKLLEFHEQSQESVVRVHNALEPLDIWVLTGCSGQVERELPWLCNVKTTARSTYVTKGYINHLQNWQDFRTLGKDILLGHCEAKPRGRETEPGIWLGDRTQVHRSATLVAPVFIGCGSRIGAAASITSHCSVERSCEIGCGTVLQDSAILAHTRVGNELHVAHAVVDGARLTDLRKNVMVTVSDPKLLSSTAPASRSRNASPSVGNAKPQLQSGLKHLPYRGAVLPRLLGFLEDEL